MYSKQKLNQRQLLPTSMKMAGFGSDAIDTTIMVVSAALVILAAFSGKRGSGGPVPVMEAPSRGPVTGRPITLALPQGTIEAIKEAMMGKGRNMPTVYLSSGSGVRNTSDRETEPARKKNVFVDFHDDTALRIVNGDGDFSVGSAKMQVDLPKIMASGKLGTLFFSIWSDPVFRGQEGFTNTLDIARTLKETLARHEGQLQVSTTRSDIEGAIGGGKVAVVLAVEGGHSINNSLDNLEALYREGIRLLTLTHWNATEWAGSAHESRERGLSGIGTDVIATMNRLGMIIDVAHVSEPTIFDVARVSKQPFVCSHGSSKSIYDKDRALSDDAIRAIAKSGGVIGITFFPEQLTSNPFIEKDAMTKMLGKLAEIEGNENLLPAEKARLSHRVLYNDYKVPSFVPGLDAVFKHIDHITRLVGDKHVAIGSDFDGVPYFCKGLEDVSKLDNLAELLATRGYSNASVGNIMGGNILRVIDNVMK